MPPRIRTRASKALKENIDFSQNKLKTTKINNKAPRKALADKTNSASDDTSIEIPKKPTTKNPKIITKENKENKSNNKTAQARNARPKLKTQVIEDPEPVSEVRPRRDRRLPSRFVENPVLNNLSNSKDTSLPHSSTPAKAKSDNTPSKNTTLSKTEEPQSSPFKTPSKIDGSLLVNRPKRICRLPSRFEDHSISPNKFIPIQPANASTPIQQSKIKPTNLPKDKGNVITKEVNNKAGKEIEEKLIPLVRVTRLANDYLKNNSIDNTSEKTSPDNNNNAKSRSTRVKKSNKVPLKNNKQSLAKKILSKAKKIKSPVNNKKITKPPVNKPKTPISISQSPIVLSPSPVNNITSPLNKLRSQINKLQSPIKKTITSPLGKLRSQINKPQSPIVSSPSPVKKIITSPLGKLRSQINTTQSSIALSPSPAKKIITSPLGRLRTQVNNPQSPISKKRVINKNLSFKVLGGKKQPENNEKNDEDPYEFTYDPNEEPQPQKKKRKRTVSKKAPSKPRTVVYKSRYEKNISKALTALKNAVKPVQNTVAPLTQIAETIEETDANKTDQVQNNVGQNAVENNANQVQNDINKSNINTALDDTGKNSVHEGNYPSIRVEDIAADLEPSTHHHDDINYSPVNSPRPNATKSPNISADPRQSPERPGPTNDPLNLQEELSFFDDPPVASSSMNISVRHPLASPWRVEFGSLPIKWHVNTYVKPNMTPAVESSFISSEDTNRKRHVYTNIGLEPNETLPEIVNNKAPNLIQTSIISFIKEVAERNAKKKRGRSVSPTKAIFEDLDTNADKSKKKNQATKEGMSTSNTSNEVSGTSDNSKEERRNRKRKNSDKISDRPAKSPRKQKDKDNTYFGFDDSENQDTENVSPVKVDNNPKGRSLRPRSRAVLQEINGPTRAVLPVAAKTKIATSSEAVNRVYEELKSAADAPQFPEKNVEQNTTNIEETVLNEDSQSVHLFEDVDVVHHVKPVRKSYGKAKKVTFRQLSTSDSDTQDQQVVAEENDSTDYDDLADLTFEIPNVVEKKTTKKKKPKNLMSKKEEQEAEAWAANFNSMCEDVEEFPLIVE